MISYSSFWDGLVKAGAVLTGACAGPFLGGEHWFTWLGASPRLSGAISVGLGLLIVLFLAADLISIVSSWLYARITLGTHVSWEDAKTFRILFQLDEKGTWLPMKEVKSLPVLDRREHLLRAAGAYAATRRMKASL